MSPNGGIGRGMKVGKEEIAGLLAAVERYLKVDLAVEARELEDRVAYILQALSKVDGIRASRHVPPIANQAPHVQIEWDEAARKPTSKQVTDQLLAGEPSIAIQRRGTGDLLISVWMMRGGEHRVVAQRLAQIFRQQV